MSDYGHDLTFGSFISPAASPPRHAVELAVLAEQAGLDGVSFQDHPYQPAFHDTWSLMSFVGARTERITIGSNVTNLPLRPPPVLARAAASLDVLTGGRVELGLGAGTFWDGVAAMGGRRLEPGQAVRALEEAIGILRGLWDVDATGPLRLEGEFYQVNGAKRGPRTPHPIPLRVGSYKPRMLRLTGRLADGWLPSLGYLPEGPKSLGDMNAYIDEGAESAGRDPRAIDRVLNLGGQFRPGGSGLFDGPAEVWSEQIADIALSHGVSGFNLMSDDPSDIAVWAQEVAPRVRDLVAAERKG
jgi:alkanesulfonate monooxygenase SsuD/methylene tetrahydromethanopterin reductase-like flavin-dependent oxidoreductase (luciferase family)